jgi:TolB-like protein/DNA-binding winged helix-turn-helix (wHTH) protein/Tfp pilus assembly protein PilF
MNALGPRCYAFGPFRLDPMAGQLTRDGAVIELRPKSLAVLHHLVLHPQRLVAKAELMAAVWDKVVVTDDSLVQCVGEIRHAIGDAEQRIVRTVPREGYVFVAEVVPVPSRQVAETLPEPVSAAAPQRPGWWVRLGGRSFVAGALGMVAAATVIGWIAVRAGDDAAHTGAAAAGAAPLSIAVLPLANIDGDPDQDYFAAGLTSDLTTDLGRIPTGLVISPNSVRAYRGRPVDARTAGRELAVRYVIEGSVQGLRDDVRVNLRLVETDTGTQRWAERFEGPRAELAQLQADIVRRIARTLQVRLLEAAADRSLRERTHDAGAQDLLMRGWALWERRRPADNARARELFEQAAAADPTFSLAWVGLANTHLSDLHAGWTGDRDRSLAQARGAVDRAAQVGPHHREVNAVRGYTLFFQGDIETALDAFDREIESNPGNALAHVWRGLMLVSLGRAAEALPAVERGIALSPRDVDLHVFYRSMAHPCFSLGRYGDARAWAQKAVGLTPDYAKGHAFVAAAAALGGDRAAAARAIETFRALQPQLASVAAFRRSLMPGERRMFDATPRFWEALQTAGLPAENLAQETMR